MANKKKKYNARFPPARIKKIMQKDEEVGKVAAPVPVIISRALELFVESLVKRASDITKSRNAKTLTTSHLKACIFADERFHFLKELVATVPDVQGEDDVNECQIMRPKLSRGRRIKNRNGDDTAGPSHSTAEETETDSVEEDDDDIEQDTDEGSSENTTENSCNAFSYGNEPVLPTVIPSGVIQNNSVEVDDDYDS